MQAQQLWHTGLAALWHVGSSQIERMSPALVSGFLTTVPPGKPLIYLFYLFLAVLGLRCCMQAFSSCGERGLPFIAVHRLLIAVASLVAEHGL